MSQVTDYKGNCSKCKGSEFDFVRDIGNSLHAIKCRSCGFHWYAEYGDVWEDPDEDL